MTPALFALLLASSLAWSGLDAARKALGRDVPAIPLVVALGLIQGLMLGAWALATGLPDIQPRFWGAAAGSIAINCVGNLLFVRALAVSPFSLTVPLLALVPVLSAGLNVFTLGEVPTPRQWGGIALIVAGAMALQVRSPRDMWAALRREPGVPMMAAVALCWTVVGPFDKTATLASSPAVAGTAINLGMGLALAPLLLRDREGTRALAKRPGLLLLACAIGVFAIASQFEVVRQAMVGLVEAVKRMTGLVAAAVVGKAAFGEEVTGRQAGAIAVMLAGTACLLL